jgi:hypothetical protein
MSTATAAPAAAATTEHAFASFAAISLKPLLQFITSECIACMPASGLNLVDFTLQLLAATRRQPRRVDIGATMQIGRQRWPLVARCGGYVIQFTYNNKDYYCK